MKSRTIKLSILAAVATLSLTSCAGGVAIKNLYDATSKDPQTEELVVKDLDLNELPKKAIEVTHQQGSVEGYVGAAEDAEVLICEGSSGGWLSAGTVSNPTSYTQNYRLYLAFLDGANTVGVKQIDIEDVASGETEQWETALSIQGENLKCFLRVERF